MKRESILVWDWPVRIGHWLTVAAFAVCWLTSESESWRNLHTVAGTSLLAIASFRILWGFIGSRHARFKSFIGGPHAVVRYLLRLFDTQPEHTTGHNPAGGWAIVALLAGLLATTLSGLALHLELAGHWLEELHEGSAEMLLAVVAIHLLGVAVGSWRHRENLVRAMVNGRKPGKPEEAIENAAPLPAALLLAWVAACVWLVLHW